MIVRRTVVISALLLAALPPASSALAQPSGEALELKRGFEAIEAWRIDEARVIAEAAYARAPDDPLVLALIAETKFHLSDYAGAVAFYDRAQAAGAPEHLLGNRPMAEAARSATRDYAESDEHFIIRYAPGKDAILVPFALETLEAARDRIGKLIGWLPSGRIVVEFYPNTAVLAQVSTLTKKEINDSGTIALCKWNRLMVTSPSALMFGYPWRDTIAHELTHLLIGGAGKNTVPIWLHEGIAKYTETAWRDRPGLGLSAGQQAKLRQKAKLGQLIPFAKMYPSMAKLKTQEDTSLAFSEVFTFLEYLVELKGYDALRNVLHQMSEGLSDVEAIETVFGTPLETLEARWSAALKNREIRRSNEIGGDRPLVIKDRPDAPDDELQHLSKSARRYARAADLLFARGRLKAAQRELEKACLESKESVLSTRLASVALANGDLDGAERAARAAVSGAAEFHLAGANVTLAEILVRRGKTVEAREPLDRAISTNPFIPRLHQLALETLGPNGSTEAKAHAQKAIEILSGHTAVQPPMLGSGARVEVEGLPFSRVYLETASGALVPTGRVTPTGPFSTRTGNVKLHFLPPSGPAIIRTVNITTTAPDAPPQHIAPAMEGS